MLGHVTSAGESDPAEMSIFRARCIRETRLIAKTLVCSTSAMPFTGCNFTAASIECFGLGKETGFEMIEPNPCAQEMVGKQAGEQSHVSLWQLTV